MLFYDSILLQFHAQHTDMKLQSDILYWYQCDQS